MMKNIGAKIEITKMLYQKLFK